MEPIRAFLAAVLLLHASYTDLRVRRVRNWAVGAAALAGLGLAAGGGGPRGLAVSAAGLGAGALWWLAVFGLGLGAGDAKLAMALGALLGPAAAVAGPATGFVLCALSLGPWALWRRTRGLRWREVPVPMAPWIAAGTLLAAALGHVGGTRG